MALAADLGEAIDVNHRKRRVCAVIPIFATELRARAQEREGGGNGSTLARRALRHAAGL